MKYYIDSIEQIKGEDGDFTEYGKREKYDNLNTALTKYYKKLSDVSAVLGVTHVYMHSQICNSLGGIARHDSRGEYTSISVDD